MNASKSGLQRSEALKVLVIDDERLSSHNLGIQLRFVGEAPVLCGSERWGEVADAHPQVEWLAVVVGVIRRIEPGMLLQDLQQKLPGVAVLQLSSDPAASAAAAPAALRPRLQVLDESRLNYASVSAALLKARELKGMAPRKLESRVISNTGSALFRSLTGKSRVMQQVRQQVQQVAGFDATVLVTGESGTGKEVVARNIHYHSGRGEAPFIAVNCAAIAPDRYGVELFGEVGAAPGLLERADGGTLYLDEVAELPQNIQTLLLRFLEDKCFHRSGSSELLSTDVRVVAATSQNLQLRIQQGLFRPDLFYRLNLMPIELPPLRKRLADIPELVQELLKNLGSRGYTPVSLNAAAIDALQHQQWPGNVRELANLIERLCIMHGEGVIGVSDLPLEYQHTGGADTDALLQEIEALTSKVEARVVGARMAEPAQAVTGSIEPGPALVEAAQVAMDATVSAAADASAELQSVEALARDGATAEAAERDSPGPAGSSSALLPLNDMLLEHYLHNFEKQLLLAALDDCANILGFAAERLELGEAELKQKMQGYQLESF